MVTDRIKLKKTEHEIEEEKKNRTKALLGSIMTYALLFLLLFFVSLSMPKEEEVPEEPLGADVMLGEDPTGMEETFEAVTSEPITQEYIAQNFSSPPDIPTEESPDLPAVKVNKNPEPDPQPVTENKPEETQPKPNDLFPTADPKKKPGTSTGTETTPGKMGLPKGKPDGKGLLPGNGGSWTLQGGNLTYIPRPVDESQVFGTIVIEITVNKQGKVIAVRGGVSGTTVINEAVIDKYERKAWETLADASENGPDKRTGYITYKLSAK